MNNKMAKNIHTYQQLNLKNKLSKQEQRIIEIVMVARWKGGVGGWVKRWGD